MAYAAVLSVMRILQEIVDHDRPVRHIKRQIQSLQEKVSSLLDFLDNYSVYTDKVVKDLEMKIRDAAYRAEDIIECYISVSILSPSVEGFPKFCRDLDRIADEVHSIQQEVMDIKGVLDLNHAQQRKTLPVDRSRLTFTDRTPLMVGFVEDSMKMKDWLTSSSSKLEVISIVGMGGIGKTTLARNLFHDPLIVYHFHVRAWVTVSQEYQMREIWLGLLDSTIKLSPEMRNESDEELAERLYKSLKGQKYLIVMDDIWDSKEWNEVKRIFPNDNNGSRIVLTTRLTTVGVDASSFDRLHDMSFLSCDESWDLFCEKAFHGESCPLDLEDTGRQIIRNCRGLPLSIVVVGGLLSTNKTASYWSTIATTLNSILATDGSQCSTIFLSYNHLPAHLRPCFLYFATFPEDYDIPRTKLVRLWVAEGFIKPNESKSLEDIAEECLGDLVNRSLVMVCKLGDDGKVKTYRIHDLLRDFCVTEVRKQKFIHVTNRYIASHPEGMRSERRISIQPFTPFKPIKYIFNPIGTTLLTRSLLLYHRDVDLILCERSFGLLRVLDMENGINLPKFPEVVIGLVHLRYLSVSCCDGIVPESICSISGLQTLVMAAWNLDGIFACLPRQAWRMRHLRHVQIRNVDCCLPDPLHPRFEGENFVILANLQTLCGIKNFSFSDEIIKRIPKLKKLRVSYGYNWSKFQPRNIVRLKELETLNLDFFPEVKFPANFKFPAALKKLTLKGCELPREDLTMIGSLPNLEVLKLKLFTCEGQVWEPNEGEFRELKSLELHSSGLIHWRANDSHFPKLKYLRISRCSGLKEIPTELGNIQTLEKIKLDRASPSAVESAELILEQQHSFGNDVLQVFIS